MKRYIFLIIIALLLIVSCKNDEKSVQIDETTRQALQEWQADKFGMFIHWGLYSVPAGVWKGEQIPYYAEQIMNHARIPAKEYEQLASQFTAADWDADSVVLLAKEAGMRYIVLTSKHHDGFCLFKTKTTNYNVVDATPYGQDVVATLADACRRHGLKLGLYYSLPDWHYEGGIPRGTPDTATKCWEHVNQLYSPLEIITPELEECIVQQLTELLTNYGEITTIWFDMGLLQPAQSQRLRQVVKSLQPNCLVSGRIMNRQGDYLTLPDNGDVVGYSDLAWDNPASMYGTWGYRSWQERPDATLQANRQIKRLMQTISHGGVFLLNIGPTGSGQVLDYEKDVLRKIGRFVQQNQEAIYHTTHSPFPQLPENICCTQKDNLLYFTVLDSVTSSITLGHLVTPISNIYLLNNPSQRLSLDTIEQGFVINLPKEYSYPTTVVVELTDNHAEVLPTYLSQNADNDFVMTNSTALTHAAFDAEGYISTQADSWKSWNLDVTTSGRFQIFVTYLPDFDDKRYRFTCDGQTIEQVLPGVDRMLQTSYIGEMELTAGHKTFELRSADSSRPLEPLGLTVDKIVLRKMKK